MSVRLHPHARARLPERGATESEVVATVEEVGFIGLQGPPEPAHFTAAGVENLLPRDAEQKVAQPASVPIEATPASRQVSRHHSSEMRIPIQVVICEITSMYSVAQWQNRP